MKRFTFLFVAVLALGASGTAFAVTMPSDTYLPSNQPLIKGTVTDVGEHSVTVDSFNGERMTFTVDSRTVMPTTMQAGTRVKVEFHAMEDGRYHAARVTPFDPTSDEIASIKPVTLETETPVGNDADRDRTYANRMESHEHATRDNVVQASTTTSGRTEVEDEQGGEDEPASAEDREDADLPGTASNSNLFGLLGLAAFVSAGSLWMLRRRSHA